MSERCEGTSERRSEWPSDLRVHFIVIPPIAGWPDLRTDGWTNTRTDRRIDGLMEGWIKRPSRSVIWISLFFRQIRPSSKDTRGGGFLMENLFGEMSWIGPGHQRLIYEIRTYSMISMFIFHVFNLPESTHCPCFLALGTLMEAWTLKKIDFQRKKVHFRSLDLGEWDHADSTEPPFQRPIFFRLTLPNPRGDFKNTPRGFPDRKPLSICIVDRSRPPKTHLCKKKLINDIDISMLTPRIKPLRVFFGTRDLDSKKYFSGKKKVHFRILDLGESDHADSNEPPFQKPIFFKFTPPHPRGDFEGTPRGFLGGKSLWICIVDRSRPPKTYFWKKQPYLMISTFIS